MEEIALPTAGDSRRQQKRAPVSGFKSLILLYYSLYRHHPTPGYIVWIKNKKKLAESGAENHAIFAKILASSISGVGAVGKQQ